MPTARGCYQKEMTLSVRMATMECFLEAPSTIALTQVNQLVQSNKMIYLFGGPGGGIVIIQTIYKLLVYKNLQ